MHHCETCKQTIYAGLITCFIFGENKYFCSDACWKKFKATEFHK